MSRGSWKVQVDVAGKRGAGQMAVPLPAVSTSSTSMQAALGILLAVLGLALCAGFVGIIGAASRDADLPPGDQPPAEKTRLSRLRMTITTAFVVIALVAANHWWGLEARANARLNYKLPRVQASLNGHTLRLELENPNATEMGRFGTIPPDRIELTDLIKDHGHLMHLFLVRMPDMNSFWHFHPDQVGEGQFTMTLPVLPAGHYRIYADVVHSTGFPETQVGEIDVPRETIPETVDRPTRPGDWPAGDDSGIADAAASEKISPLSGGYHMVWLRDEAPLNANQPFWFRFRVEDKDGKPATDLEPYMGMAGHAVFISSDGGAFAHVHPAGSVSMAAVDIAAGRAPSLSSSDMSAMPGMQHDHQGAEVSFPYGFPRPGDYRIFVQIKRGGHVETGSFLAQAH
jgi:hypothetical protein